MPPKKSLGSAWKQPVPYICNYTARQHLTTR